MFDISCSTNLNHVVLIIRTIKTSKINEIDKLLNLIILNSYYIYIEYTL